MKGRNMLATKNYARVALMLLVFISASCNKNFLDQKDPNAVTISDNFKTASDDSLAVNGIYQSLRDANNIGEDSGLWTDERSDDDGRNDAQSNSGEPFQFNDFSLLPSNSFLFKHWSSLYNTISRANTVLNYTNAINFANPKQKQVFTAEAKFLRALMYFHLVRLWGDVPLVTKNFEDIQPITALTFRAKTDTVYKQIVSDLNDAVNSPLPDVQTPSSLGRVSKAAANTLLGQVYLTMALTTDPANRMNNLNNAKTFLMTAYHFKTFSDLSSIPYTDVFDVTKKASCPELIWQMPYIQGDLNYSSSIAASNQAKGSFVNSKKPAAGAGGNVTGDLIKEYEANDLRKDFSVTFSADKNVQDWFISKYRDTSALAGVNGYGGNDWPLMRYADVILMLAEVTNYLGDQASAIAFVNMVRKRAKMPDYATSMQNIDYAKRYPTLKLAILHERRVELAFEHHRWFDLIRTFSTDELVAYFHAKNQADYGLAQLSNFSTKDRFYPIPFNETKLDPVRMYQNPGY